MSVPTNQRTLNTVTNITGSNSSTTWYYTNPRPTVNANTLPSFNRQIVLSDMGLLFTRAGSSVGIVLEDLCVLAAAACPGFTWPPQLSNQSNNVIAAGGAATSFSANFTDERSNVTNDITYQWVFGTGANITANAVYSNVTTTALNISNVQLANASNQTFICVATNPSGTTNSGMRAVADIVSQPSNSSVAHPNSASFSTTVYSGGTVSYAWAANGAYITSATNANYSNWSTNTLTVGNSTGLNGTTYLCTISLVGAANANTNSATLVVT